VSGVLDQPVATDVVRELFRRGLGYAGARDVVRGAGETAVSFGPRAVLVFDDTDRAMRNLSIVALRRAGVSGIEVAPVFELMPEHVSRLYDQEKELGSAAPITEMGCPRSLDARGTAREYALSDARRSGAETSRELGVSEATVSRLLARRLRPEVAQLELGNTSDDPDDNAAGNFTAEGGVDTPSDASRATEKVGD